MECKQIPPVSYLPCKPSLTHTFDFIEALKSLGFSDIQIEWVKEDLLNWFGPVVRISSITHFPVNHKYGFTNISTSTKGSKWNCLITINDYPDFYYLLQKNLITQI